MAFLVAMLVASAIALSMPLVSSSSSSSHDVESLMAFKKAISHDPSRVLGDWNVPSHNNSHCNWNGITCSSKHPGRVVSLNLAQSSLQGIISPHVGNLSFLHYLNISFNAFTGIIPPAIGNLGKLRVLYLSSNSLTGILPPQLGRLKNLRILYARDNTLSRNIPPSLRNCSKLEEIALSDNNLSGNIPKGIGSLTRLYFLNLANNSLTGNIPQSIQNLTSLKAFILFGNKLGGTLPSWIGKLSKLEKILFGANNFSGNIPRSLVNCTSLERIEFAFNNLHGALPSSLGMLPNMKGLSLSHNHWKGTIPESLSNATGLRIIDLGQNEFQGTIPLSFGRLSQLEGLNAHDNHIESGITRGSHQPIPILQALCNCSKLAVINLYHNNLHGSLPSVLPKQLEEIYLSNNLISGNIPASIGNSSELILLALTNNHLKGSIPPAMGCMKSLQALDLGGNMLEGTIPDQISSLNKSLFGLYLSSNNLSGSIPKSIGGLSYLRDLDLSDNSFSGRIPHELGNCVLLEDLQLSFNNLSGEIPREVANLRNIHFRFDLSNNKLSRDVPPEIGGLQMALHIDLSNNHLFGQIGLYMGNWFNIQYINVSCNKFSGNLAESLGAKQTGLKSIDLSYNNFSGIIPSSLYNHSDFQVLNFSYNNFEGGISCSGAFKKLSHTSFLHNHLLCGKCMGLPSCVDISTKHSHSHFYKSRWFIIIVALVGLSCMVTSCYLLFFHKKRQEQLNMEEPMNPQLMVVSKQDLMRATNNFSEANLIGRGSYGAVYSGVLHNGDLVAVKIFNIANEQRSNASFIRECQTLGKVRHRNLTKIITVCCEENFRAIVLPLMVKGSLHDLLHERDMEELLTPFTLETKMRIISELAGALSYLHHDCTPSIVHCDVKPENVLLDNDMAVKLTDFGIAKIMKSFSLESTTQSLRGSIGYVAPEYGVGGDVSSEGDVYSFGIVTLEVMTRKKPTDDMFNSNMSMLEWVSMALGEQEKMRSIVEIEDPREEDMKRMEGLMKLGVVCCNEDPHQRPTMREVENVLSMLGEKGRFPQLDEIIDSMHKVQPPADCSSSSSTFY